MDAEEKDEIDEYGEEEEYYEEYTPNNANADGAVPANISHIEQNPPANFIIDSPNQNDNDID